MNRGQFERYNSGPSLIFGKWCLQESLDGLTSQLPAVRRGEKCKSIARHPNYQELLCEFGLKALDIWARGSLWAKASAPLTFVLQRYLQFASHRISSAKSVAKMKETTASVCCSGWWWRPACIWMWISRDDQHAGCRAWSYLCMISPRGALCVLSVMLSNVH